MLSQAGWDLIAEESLTQRRLRANPEGLDELFFADLATAG